MINHTYLKTAVCFYLFCISLTSCTVTRTAVLLPAEKEDLELYSTKLPERAYVEVCYIQTDGSLFHTPQDLLNGLKKKAIELDADAVVNLKYDFQGVYPILSGVAIVYER